MDDETKPTVDEILKKFQDTIFWNWSGDLDDSDKPIDEEYPLDRRDHVEGEGEDAYPVTTLKFVSGECEIHVADLRPCPKDRDLESHIGEADVEFLQNLPVYLPTLCREILRLRKLGHAGPASDAGGADRESAQEGPRLAHGPHRSRKERGAGLPRRHEGSARPDDQDQATRLRGGKGRLR